MDKNKSTYFSYLMGWRLVVLLIALFFLLGLIFIGWRTGSFRRRVPNAGISPANNQAFNEGDSRPGQPSAFLDNAIDPETVAEEITQLFVPTPAAREATAAEEQLNFGDLIFEPLAAGSLRLWHFSAESGNVIDILLTPLGDDGSINLAAELYNPDGSLLLRLDEGGEMVTELGRGILLPASGEYTLWISDDDFADAGIYQLLLLNDLTKNSYPLRLGIGQQANGIIGAGAWQPWLFSGNADEVVSIRLSSAEGADIDLSLGVTAPTGALLVERNNAGNGESEAIIGLVLPLAGNYTVWVKEEGGANAGSFTLEVSP